jgi:Tfp pilus assembly protein PilF
MELVGAERYGEAVEAFRKCVELDESNLPAHVEAAKAMRSEGDLKAARAMFAVAMELAAMQGESHVRDYIQQQLDGLPR